MKIKVLYILFFISVFALHAQKGVRLGYIDMNYILENVEEYQEANKQLEKKVLKWKREVEDQKRTIAQMRADLNAEKVLLTKELVEEREIEIDALESEMIKYQQDRFGPGGDMIMQRSQLAQPIQDQVFNAIQDIAKKRNYDFVFDKSADVVMLYSNKAYDISDMVLTSIDRNRKRGGVANKSEPETELKKFEEDQEQEPTEAQKAAEAKKKEALSDREKRKLELEAERQARLKDIEERKKAYEARRKKILEERQKLRDSLRRATQKQKDSIN
ncbi:periplasmic chaperone for outer membrane proteins Skp [Zhouia amylolytica]|uniref:Periplasmic chaperone for outer membrane proteins Skp n=1 Tax=Zhouia amylolytica TaxID=376730 RepID=A0A1I6RFI0_9FLAO|nr:OmpH family outer membrane protein [Zhouia amylolytica]MCQ0110642.1 OmpH family outer membrane protein [Zhouia amylolytica]SFS63320.1 periplasmic chaperone for outer membrane proteins Skp [Zhouia amylolytica]